MHIDQSLHRVRSYRRFMDWSLLRLATEAGLNESTIRRLDEPEWSPTASTLRKLEAIIPSAFDPKNMVPLPESGDANPGAGVEGN